MRSQRAIPDKDCKQHHFVATFPWWYFVMRFIKNGYLIKVLLGAGTYVQRVLRRCVKPFYFCASAWNRAKKWIHRSVRRVSNSPQSDFGHRPVSKPMRVVFSFSFFLTVSMFLCFHVLFLSLIGRLPTYLPVNKAQAILNSLNFTKWNQYERTNKKTTQKVLEIIVSSQPPPPATVTARALANKEPRQWYF